MYLDSDCEACPLHALRTSVVPGETGKLYDGVVLLGEAPGGDEDRARHPAPFIGPAGEYLTLDLLQPNGMSRASFHLTNLAKCWPHIVTGPRRFKTVAPKAKETRTCAEWWLWDELAALSPKAHTIVTLGNVPTQFLLPGQKIGVAHGRVFEADLPKIGKVRVIPVYHPAAKLHNPALEKVIKDDFAALPALLLEGTPESPHEEQVDYTHVTTWEQALEMRDVIRGASELAIDTESYEEDVSAAHQRILGISVSVCGGAGYYIESGTPGFRLVCSAARHAIRNPSQTILFWNAGHDLQVLGCVRDATNYHDGLLMAYVLEQPFVGLKEVTKRRLGIDTPTFNEVKKQNPILTYTKKGKEKWVPAPTLLGVPAPVRAKYAAGDADYTFRLCRLLASEMDANHVGIYRTLELPLAPIVSDMVAHGVLADQSFLAGFTERVAAAKEEAK